MTVGYARVSTDLQEESLERQTAKIAAYCALRGLAVPETVFVDEDVSARKVPIELRPAGAELVRRCVKGDLDVVALRLDRLFRSVTDGLGTIEAWTRRGVRLHLIDEGGCTIDASTPMGWAFLVFRLMHGELEARVISARTSGALQHKRRQNEAVGTVPYGSRLASDGKHSARCGPERADTCTGCRNLEDDPDEQRAVARIRSLRASGESLRGIVTHLNQSDCQDRYPARGERWHLSGIRRILAQD